MLSYITKKVQLEILMEINLTKSKLIKEKKIRGINLATIMQLLAT